MLVLQCWCCYSLPHVPLWFQYLSIWEKHNGNCVINTNGHKSSLFYDGIKQNKTSSVKHLEKKHIFTFILNILIMFMKATVAALRMSRCTDCMWNLCITGFLFPCEWSHPAADTLLWLLQCHLMKLLEWGDTICDVFYKHGFLQPLYRPSGFPGGWGCHISRQLAHEGEQVFSPMHWLPLPTRRYSWYSFLLQAELTPGSKCGWKDVNKKFQWHRRESNLWPSSL